MSSGANTPIGRWGAVSFLRIRGQCSDRLNAKLWPSSFLSSLGFSRLQGPVLSRSGTALQPVDLDQTASVAFFTRMNKKSRRRLDFC
jgi:hypothetical protein